MHIATNLITRSRKLTTTTSSPPLRLLYYDLIARFRGIISVLMIRFLLYSDTMSDQERLNRLRRLMHSWSDHPKFDLTSHIVQTLLCTCTVPSWVCASKYIQGWEKLILYISGVSAAISLYANKQVFKRLHVTRHDLVSAQNHAEDMAAVYVN